MRRFHSILTNVGIALGIVGVWYYFILRTPLVSIEPRTKVAPDFSWIAAPVDAPESATSPLASPQPGSPTLAAFQGKTVFITFWASWCSACRTEFDELRDLRAALPLDSFVMLSVATQDQPDGLRELWKEVSLPFPILWDPSGQIAESYGVQSIPQSFVVDKDGYLRFHIQGPLRGSHIAMLKDMITKF